MKTLFIIIVVLMIVVGCGGQGSDLGSANTITQGASGTGTIDPIK